MTYERIAMHQRRTSRPFWASRVVQVLGLALLWTLALLLTFYAGSEPTSERVRYTALPFFVTWAGAAILLPVILGSTLERLGWRVYVVIAVILLVPGLYYVIGRPFELQALQEQTPYRLAGTGTFFDPGFELFLPISIGAVLAAVYGAIYRVTRRRRQGAFRYVFASGIALYILTGLLLWMHSAAAWAALRVSGVASSPVQQPWIRFVDEVGPHSVWWQVFTWPWISFICCG
ncbi:MAG: hypothetical protein WD208_00220 [Dehalococcoidia bacterium]